MIHYFGLAGEPDKVEAYAWATVAQEEGIVILRQLSVLIGQELDESQLRRARERFEELDQAYGSVIVTQRSERPDCVGSRVGAGCERVVREIDRSPSSDMPDFYRNVTGPNEITPAYVADFSDTYADHINQEFAKFDQGG